MLGKIKPTQVQASSPTRSRNSKDFAAQARHCNLFNYQRCDSFYNIPSTLGKSPKSGIGLGKKIDIFKKEQSPSPSNYSMISDFDVTKKNLSMGKMALGREVI